MRQQKIVAFDRRKPVFFSARRRRPNPAVEVAAAPPQT